VSLGHAREGFGRERREMGVAHGAHRRRAGPGPHERHLADELAGTHLLEEALAARLVRPHGAQASAQDQVGRVPGFALAEELLASGEEALARLGREGVDRLGGKIPEHAPELGADRSEGRGGRSLGHLEPAFYPARVRDPEAKRPRAGRAGRGGDRGARCRRALPDGDGRGGQRRLPARCGSPQPQAPKRQASVVS
jgi:hypothetical protein